MSSHGASGSPDGLNALNPSDTIPRDLPKEATATYNSSRSFDPAAITHRKESPDAKEMSFSTTAGLSKWSMSQGLPDPHSLAAAGTGHSGEAEFTLIDVVGRGGMGEVLRAYQHSLGRRIAVKRIRPDCIEEIGQVAADHQFRQEALIAAQVEHPNVVPVHDLGVDEQGNLLLAMKLVQGRAWDKILADDFQTMSEADLLIKHLPILRATAQAVVFAHDRGIVHRDIKPSQVMVGEYGEVVLMDWGLALLFRPSEASQTPRNGIALPTLQTGTSPCGTPALMAPEQTLPTAEFVGPWTDVYLMGGTLYYLLTGYFPHSSSSARESYIKATLGEVVPPAQRAPNRRHPSDLANLCMKALAQVPADRHESAGAFLAALDDHLTGSTRRREAQAIVAEATQQLDQGAPTYDALAAISARLDHASRLHGDHPELPTLRDRLAVDYARVALSLGDLALASVHAHRIGDERLRTSLSQDIAEATAHRERRERQRRWMVVALVLLLGLLALGAVVTTQQRTQTRLIREMMQLLADEAQLAAIMSNRFPPPLQTNPEDRPLNSSAEAMRDGQRLMARRESLAGRRENLERRAPGTMGPPPSVLLDAEAFWLLNSGENDEDFQRAKALLEAAVAERPNDVEAIATLGIALSYCNDYGGATERLKQALELERASPSPRPRVLASYSLALAELVTQRPDIRIGTRDLALEALAVYEPEAARSLLEIARARAVIGPLEEGVRATEMGVELLKDYQPAEHDLLQRLRGIMGVILTYLGRFAEATTVMEAQIAKEMGRAEGPSDETFVWINNLASVYRNMGEFRKAAEIMDEMMATLPEKMNTDDPAYHRIRTHYALVLRLVGRSQEALAIYDEELSQANIAKWLTQIDYAQGLGGYAQVLSDVGRHDEAIAAAKRSVEIIIEELGPEDRTVFLARTTIASVLNNAGRSQEALEMYEIMFRERPADIVDESPDLITALNNYSSALFSAGRARESLDVIDQLLATRGYDDATGEARDGGPKTMIQLGNWLHIAFTSGEGDKEKVRQRLKGYLAMAAENELTAEQEFRAARVEGGALKYLEDFDGAIAAHERAVQFRDAVIPSSKLNVGWSYNDIGILSNKLERWDDAREAYKEARDYMASLGPSGQAYPAIYANNMARNYMGEAAKKMELGESAESVRPLIDAALEELAPYLADVAACKNDRTVGAIALALMMSGRCDEAIPILEELARRRVDLSDMRERTLSYCPDLLPMLGDAPTSPTTGATP